MTDAPFATSMAASSVAQMKEDVSSVPTQEKYDATPATLRHIAIIPDGNRRWARARGIREWDGVREGAKATERTLDAIRARGVPWCTFWASSYDNLSKRPAGEREVLNELFATWFMRLVENPTIHRDRIRVRVLGEWRDLLSERSRASIDRAIAATAAYDGGALTFLIGYDGDRELVAAVRGLLQQGTENREPDFAKASPGRQETGLTIDDLRKHAWTNELPEVDLLIRTGSWEDPHRSANFLPLLTSNVQESYPQVYWPDFSESQLQRVIDDFAARERRLGA
ncbi:MAG: polyprenyl diphosphate synthase [bacterium]|nr:polyprenyl diphosphate synthase [bacterium]